MSALLQEEELENIVIKGKSQILEKLKEKKLLRYGSIIPESEIAIIMNANKEKLTFEKWQFVLLEFREIIKNEGFFLTSRGRNNELYILQPHEMPISNAKKTKNVFRNLKQRQRALHMIDTSLLGEEHQKKLEFEILKNAALEIEMANHSKSRCRY